MTTGYAPTLWPLPPLWRETRVPVELARLMRDPVWRGEGIPRGDDRPVLLVCGFLAGDPSLTTMARWLSRNGHHPVRAGLRWNVGCLGDTVDRLERRASELVERCGGRIAVIGQSRGGNCAKALAVRRPDLVESVVALGSPLLDQLDVHPSVWAQAHLIGALGTLGLPGLLSAECRDGGCCSQALGEVSSRLPPEVAMTSIYSCSDGIVRWRSCLDPDAELVEIEASHIGMAVSAQAYRVIAEALA